MIHHGFTTEHTEFTEKYYEFSVCRWAMIEYILNMYD